MMPLTAAISDLPACNANASSNDWRAATTAANTTKMIVRTDIETSLNVIGMCVTKAVKRVGWLTPEEMMAKEMVEFAKRVALDS